ncbi:MAG: tetratricopeptide repeat protein [Rubrivivax sp.]|jgi:type VI secretion system protein ImpE|nr:tetratricopeptide repeat protein [Rubrivivax sp.]
MPNTAAAEQALKSGQAKDAIKLLTEQVRSHPQDAKLRIFLFQLMCVTGQWERALNQLNVAFELDASTLPMVQTYREAIACEALRQAVFSGHKAPMLFGEPETWTALFIEALLREGRGEHDAGRQLREQALEQAPASSGAIHVGAADPAQPGARFEWIADADTRLGPVVEAVINGKYYWLPFNRLAQIDIEAPKDLRDAVWMPAEFLFTNGGQVVGLIPTRYPGTELASGDALAMARATDWHEVSPGIFHGLGQRLWTTDQGDHALMDVRKLSIDELPADVEPADGSDDVSAT